MKSENPYKGHICDGGDDYGLVDCLQCEKQMLWSVRTPKKELEVKSCHCGCDCPDECGVHHE